MIPLGREEKGSIPHLRGTSNIPKSLRSVSRLVCPISEFVFNGVGWH